MGRTVSIAECVQGARKGGMVRHFIPNGSQFTLCGRYVLPGSCASLRPCKSCVRVGGLVIDATKGEGCRWPDSAAYDMIDYIVSLDSSPRTAALAQSWRKGFPNIDAAWVKYMGGRTSVDRMKPAAIKALPFWDNQGEGRSMATQFMVMVLSLNAIARGENVAKPKPAKVAKPKLIMNTAVTENEEFINGGPVIEKAKRNGGDGMVNPNSTTKAKPARCGASEKQAAWMLRMVEEINDETITAKYTPEFLDTIPWTKIGDHIDTLKAGVANARKAKAAAPVASPRTVTEAVTVGMYKVGDRIFKVIPSQTGRLYAKELCRCVEDGFRFEYAPGAISSIKAEHRMSMEEAQAFGRLTGTCCVCGRMLTDETSIARGIGPVCGDKF